MIYPKFFSFEIGPIWQRSKFIKLFSQFFHTLDEKSEIVRIVWSLVPKKLRFSSCLFLSPLFYPSLLFSPVFLVLPDFFFIFSNPQIKVC